LWEFWLVDHRLPIANKLNPRSLVAFDVFHSIGTFAGQKLIDDSEWRFLLTGGVGVGKDVANPAPGWFPDARWGELTRACQLEKFSTLDEHFKNNLEPWKALYDSSTPYSDPMPAPLEEEMTDLQKLLLLRLVRPDKITPKVVSFVINNLGQKYTEPPPFDLPGTYGDSECTSALVFVLSPGSDPASALAAFGETMGMGGDRTQSISLGQGQGPIAEEMIKQAMVTGTWVVLQNCHLATSWMSRLEFICDEWMVPKDTHTDFRLWLTSYPSNDFPVSILQNGTKMTNEPPKGLRANVYRSYINNPISDPDFFEGSNKPARWEKMIFALAFFHALVQERRQFGPLGFNIPYGFDDSDLRISLRQMQMFVNDYDELPLEALTYCVGQCNYGGRVTDDWDRRCLLSLLSIFFNDTLVTDDNYKFSPSGIYYAPPKGDFESYKAYIQSLPQIPHPEIFGMHANADISKDQKETNELFDSILLTLPRQASGVGKSPNEIVDEMCESILDKVADVFNTEAVQEKFPVLYEESMNTVLGQECVRFNRLIVVVRSTLKDIRKAIVGLVVMSTELEQIYNSMLIGKIPARWAKSSYPSLKPLGGYVKDLIRRLDFLNKWIDEGKPASYWVSGFYFTQAFLTGARQNYARQVGVAIDLLVFDFNITKTETDDFASITEPPDIGVYVYGLFMEGMKWDRDTMKIGESPPKVLYDMLPVMQLAPVLMADARVEPHFKTPVYKTTERKGVLATTGHSSNFVMDILLPSDEEQFHWINRGAALLCSLSD
jgi:dynein heavy chain